MKTRRRHARALLALCLAWPALTRGEVQVEAACTNTSPPGFALDVAGAGHSVFQPEEAPFEIERERFRVRLTALPGDEWELEVEPKRGAVVRRVYFPWQPVKPILDAGGQGTIYLGRELGVALDVRGLGDGATRGCRYPGKCFSPLAILEVGDRAQGIAAANWPPQAVTVVAEARGMGLRYATGEDTGVQRFRALHTAACGRDAWHAAADSYREWLETRMRAESLLPIPLSDAVQQAEGWWSLHLQNSPNFDISHIRRGWEHAEPRLGWIQIWGQMSNFAGARSKARPRLQPGEETGCCLVRIPLHERYRERLPGFVRDVAKQGLIGLFARAGPEPLFDAAGRETDSLRRLRAWLLSHRELGANAFYIDVLGAKDLGDPLLIAKMLTREPFRGAVIEYPMDLYPAGYLASGSLEGGGWRGGPDADLSRHERVVFPRLGRSVLRDRVIFLGENNASVGLWGEPAAYWLQRQVFLLGVKFDAIHLGGSRATPGEPGRVMDEIIAERRRSGFWGRRPVYLDRRGLGPLPEGIDARRFAGAGGEDVLTIENWELRRGQHLELEGRRIAVPADRRFSIVVLEPDT